MDDIEKIFLFFGKILDRLMKETDDNRLNQSPWTDCIKLEQCIGKLVAETLVSYLLKRSG
jgi:hypothetical protein